MEEPRDAPTGQRRPFIGVRFECCNVYTRIYRHHRGTHYSGRCPRCSRPVRMDVAEGGSGSRFWRAG